MSDALFETKNRFEKNIEMSFCFEHVSIRTHLLTHTVTQYTKIAILMKMYKFQNFQKSLLSLSLSEIWIWSFWRRVKEKIWLSQQTPISCDLRGEDLGSYRVFVFWVWGEDRIRFLIFRFLEFGSYTLRYSIRFGGYVFMDILSMDGWFDEVV